VDFQEVELKALDDIHVQKWPNSLRILNVQIAIAKSDW